MAGAPGHVMSLPLPASEEVDRVFFDPHRSAFLEGKDREQDLELLIASIVADDLSHTEACFPEVLTHAVPLLAIVIYKARIRFGFAGHDEPIASR